LSARSAVRALRIVAAGLAVGPALLAAQGTSARRTAAPAALPGGWRMRLDRDNLPADYRLTTTPGGLRVTTVRAAGILYEPHTTATGAYRVDATLTQTKAPAHPEAYGLFIGGAGLETPAQDYLYFVVRGDGKYLIKHRAGEQVHTLADWTASPAVHSADGSGRATNALRIDVGRDSVRFYANGTRVAALPRVVRTDGIVGLRVNHALDLQVEGPRVTPAR
jgi:hypothetical protein